MEHVTYMSFPPGFTICAYCVRICCCSFRIRSMNSWLSFHFASGFLRNTPKPLQGASSKTRSAVWCSFFITLVESIKRVSMLCAPARFALRLSSRSLYWWISKSHLRATPKRNSARCRRMRSRPHRCGQPYAQWPSPASGLYGAWCYGQRAMRCTRRPCWRRLRHHQIAIRSRLLDQPCSPVVRRPKRCRLGHRAWRIRTSGTSRRQIDLQTSRWICA